MSRAADVAKEPSSWAGLAAIVSGIGLLAPQYAPVVSLLTTIFGAAAIALREQAAAQDNARNLDLSDTQGGGHGGTD